MKILTHSNIAFLSRDQGTDVVDILAGRVIPLRLGKLELLSQNIIQNFELINYIH